IDYCTVCEGIWLDAGELELLLESVEEKDTVLNSFVVDTTTKEKKVKCPLCIKRMDKILCGKDKGIRIDKCTNGHGIWFDKGELQEIIKAGAIDANNKILTMLKDMFAHTVS
ncbi:MAG: zf-TFIIB domain-containing protein, partial [Candidatus Omnitrophica bacterium]|nr:zf-TFIIB domain-containing protein [Candidatus Omnitrophota bacterium]